MRILFLTQIIPYPPNAGPRIKTWHVLRYLVESGHQVTLASFIRPEETTYLPVLEKLCHRVFTVPIHRARPADLGYWLRSHLTGRPFLVERDGLPEMFALVHRLVAADEVDLIQADQLSMAQFALKAGSAVEKPPALIFDAHNATWMILDRMLENTPFYLRLPLRIERDRMRRYESELLRRFDHILAVTDIDRKAFLEIAENGQPPKPISVIPIAVDTVQLPPVRLDPASKKIVTLGTLQYPPNADGIRWFLRDVFPLVRRSVPDAELTIMGKNPPADFFKLAEPYGSAVEITGYVDDLQPYLAASALMVVPVLAGGGMRVRILEAFSRAVPVVTTTIGLEGIDAQPGSDVLVEDQPGPFAAAVVRLLEHPDQRQLLADNSRRLAVERYDWQVVLRKMNPIYQGFENRTHADQARNEPSV